MNNYYEVHDLFFASFCVANGLTLREVYRRQDGWVVFRFDAAPMPKMLLEAVNPKTTINYQRWLAAEKFIRGMMKSAR